MSTVKPEGGTMRCRYYSSRGRRMSMGLRMAAVIKIFNKGDPLLPSRLTFGYLLSILLKLTIHYLLRTDPPKSGMDFDGARLDSHHCT